MDWKRELVIAHLVKQKIAEVDVEGLWENTLPEVASTEEQLLALESELQHSLDPEHRQFLLHADGWQAFMQRVDILGATDLVGGNRRDRAEELLGSLEDLKSLCGFSRSELLPIAVSSEDIDVMVLARPSSAQPGKVFWLAGAVVEHFEGFNEWFLAMVDYNRYEYQRLLKRVGH